jgi:hypothetical protein
MKAYFIRWTATNKMVSAFEGKSGKARADYLVEVHNRLYKNDQWFVSEEVV